MEKQNQNIVIIGGGFAGVEMAEQLLKAGYRGKIILVDKNNYNFFPPLLYQFATGFLDISNISYPFRKYFRNHPAFRFRMGSLVAVRAEDQVAVLDNGEIHYDQLIIATGTVSNYFGNEHIRQHSFPMKTIGDAVTLKNRLLERLEVASRLTDQAKKDRLTTFVIAGGGPTGVEIAGMLSELRKNILHKDYPELAGCKMDIYLVDGLPALLSPMSKKSQAYAKSTLEQMGVIIRLGQVVKDYKDHVVLLADGTTIETDNLIWTAGVTGQLFEGLAKESYGKGNRLLTDAYSRVTGTANIYAIGDSSLMTADPAFPNGHPQLAQVALQQAAQLAHNIISETKGRGAKAFRYKDRGSMAIISRNKAVADLTGPLRHFQGFFAWLIWIFVHLMSLINLRNKITTLFNWYNAYITRDQPLRMIIDAKNNPPAEDKSQARF